MSVSFGVVEMQTGMEDGLQMAVSGNVRQGDHGVAANTATMASAFVYPPDDGSRAYRLIRKARQQSDEDETVSAVATCRLAITQARAMGSPLIECWALGIKATCLASVGLRKEAMSCAGKALKLAQGLGDMTMQARACFAISFVALESNDKTQAQAMLERSRDLARMANSDYDLCWALCNLSHIHGEQAEQLSTSADRAGFAVALQALFDTANDALVQADRTNDWAHRCYAMLNLAQAYFLSGDFDKSHSLISEYGALARVHNAPRLMAYANLDRARLLAEKGLLPAAVAQISSDDHLHICCRTDDLRLRTAEALARMNRDMGDFEQAYNHLSKARDLERNIQDFQADRHIALLTAQMELDEAHAEATRAQAEATALDLRNQLLEKDREKQLRDAMMDALTGLGNRRAADIAFDMYTDLAVSEGQAFQVAFLDLDHFKQVNDQHGHPIGDQVLITLGQILQSSIRTKDEVFRFGGEEFVILMADETLAAGRYVCERLRLKIERYEWGRVAPDLTVTASIGLAVWQPGDDGKDVIARADTALYRAKETGRNRVVLL